MTTAIAIRPRVHRRLAQLRAGRVGREAFRRRTVLAAAREIRSQLAPILKQSDVAAILGISASRVDQIELNAIAKVARAYHELDIPRRTLP